MFGILPYMLSTIQHCSCSAHNICMFCVSQTIKDNQPGASAQSSHMTLPVSFSKAQIIQYISTINYPILPLYHIVHFHLPFPTCSHISLRVSGPPPHTLPHLAKGNAAGVCRCCGNTQLIYCLLDHLLLSML